MKGKYALKIHSMIFFQVEDVIGKIEILLIFGSKIVEFNNYLFRYSWYNFITKHLITIVHLYERAHCMGSNLCVLHVLLHVYDIWKDLFCFISYRLESFINLYIYKHLYVYIYDIMNLHYNVSFTYITKHIFLKYCETFKLNIILFSQY